MKHSNTWVLLTLNSITNCLHKLCRSTLAVFFTIYLFGDRFYMGRKLFCVYTVMSFITTHNTQHACIVFLFISICLHLYTFRSIFHTLGPLIQSFNKPGKSISTSKWENMTRMGIKLSERVREITTLCIWTLLFVEPKGCNVN